MKSGVTKQELVGSLATTLRLTRTGVVDLELADKEEAVMIHFKNGATKTVNIACDSGIAIIRDVCRVID